MTSTERYKLREQLKALRIQPYFGGRLYTCFVCGKDFTGGHHGFLTEKEGICRVCPGCWPGILKKLEAAVRNYQP